MPPRLPPRSPCPSPCKPNPTQKKSSHPIFAVFCPRGRLWKISAAAWAFPRTTTLPCLPPAGSIAWATSSSILLSIPKRAPMKRCRSTKSRKWQESRARSTSPWKWPDSPSQAPRISAASSTILRPQSPKDGTSPSGAPRRITSSNLPERISSTSCRWSTSP